MQTVHTLPAPSVSLHTRRKAPLIVPEDLDRFKEVDGVRVAVLRDKLSPTLHIHCDGVVGVISLQELLDVACRHTIEASQSGVLDDL